MTPSREQTPEIDDKLKGIAEALAPTLRGEIRDFAVRKEGIVLYLRPDSDDGPVELHFDLWHGGPQNGGLVLVDAWTVS